MTDLARMEQLWLYSYPRMKRDPDMDQDYVETLNSKFWESLSHFKKHQPNVRLFNKQGSFVGGKSWKK